MFAMKNNRQVRIEEQDKKKFVDLGYKIASEVDGKLEFEEVETPESAEIVSLKAEIEALREELEVKASEIESLKGPSQDMAMEEAEEKATTKDKKTKEEGK